MSFLIVRETAIMTSPNSTYVTMSTRRLWTASRPAAVLAGTSADAEPVARVAAWLKQNPDSVGRALTSLDAIRSLPHPGLAPLSVALRTLRGAIRSGSAS